MEDLVKRIVLQDKIKEVIDLIILEKKTRPYLGVRQDLEALNSLLHQLFEELYKCERLNLELAQELLELTYQEEDSSLKYQKIGYLTIWMNLEREQRDESNTRRVG